MYGADDSEQPQRMPHGYSNETIHRNGVVTKRFTGADAAARADTEVRALRAVHPGVPVPTVEAATDQTVTCAFVPGTHGQDLLNADTAARLLTACGRVLLDIHTVPVSVIQPPSHAADVLVHGDFGPQNILFEPRKMTVAAVVDWEWAHVGRPMEDLAWCEWVVRTHHPECADALPHLYHGYGVAVPPWQRRQAAMVAKCRAMHTFAARSHDGTAVEWQRRIAITRAWRE